MRIKAIIISSVIALISGCSTIDISSCARFDESYGGSDYQVTQVNGKPAERAQSEIETLIPYVLIDDGNHELTFKYSGTRPRPDYMPEEKKVIHEFEKGRLYTLYLGNDGSFNHEPKITMFIITELK